MLSLLLSLLRLGVAETELCKSDTDSSISQIKQHCKVTHNRRKSLGGGNSSLTEMSVSLFCSRSVITTRSSFMST